jgi:hypothetical protein
MRRAVAPGVGAAPRGRGAPIVHVHRERHVSASATLLPAGAELSYILRSCRERALARAGERIAMGERKVRGDR